LFRKKIKECSIRQFPNLKRDKYLSGLVLQSIATYVDSHTQITTQN